MKSKIRVAVIDNDCEFRSILASHLNKQNELFCFSDFKSCREAIENLHELKPDVVVLNTVLAGVSAIQMVNNLVQELSPTQFMFCTDDDDTETILDAIKAGAKGYILRYEGIEKIHESIIDLHRGGAPISKSALNKILASIYSRSSIKDVLTRRENEILTLLGIGLRYKEIAERLFITMDTVRTHTQHIYKKLRVTSRTAALRKVEEINN